MDMDLIHEVEHLLDDAANRLADEMLAMNLCKQSIREAVQKIEQQGRKMDQLRKTLENLKSTDPLPSSGWQKDPVQVIQIQHPPQRAVMPDQKITDSQWPSDQARPLDHHQSHRNDLEGTAPTTVLKPPDPKETWMQFVLHRLLTRHPQWVWEYGEKGSLHMASGKLTLILYPEEPIRIQIKAPRKASRKLNEGISKLNRLQQTWNFSYIEGYMVCETWCAVTTEENEAVAYCEAAMQNYFKEDYQA